MICSLQPGIIIDNRLGGDARKKEPDLHSGDFISPEWMMPAEGEADVLGRDVPWELCLTLNEVWGYTGNKPWDYKTAENLIHMLVECVSKGGNMLYAHIFDRRVGSFRLDGLEGKLKKTLLLEDGSELPLIRPWNGGDYPEDAFVELGIAGLYDEKDTVLELELL